VRAWSRLIYRRDRHRTPRGRPHFVASFAGKSVTGASLRSGERSPLPPSQPPLQFPKILRDFDDPADAQVLLDRSFEEVGQDAGGNPGVDAGHRAGA